MTATKPPLLVEFVHHKAFCVTQRTELCRHWSLFHRSWNRLHNPYYVANTLQLCESRLRGVKEGVLTRVFGGPVAKVLDQAVYVGSMEQTIPMLVESTGLSFKTAQKAILELNKLGLVKRSRKIGNAQTYRFDVRNDLHELIAWAEKLKISRLRH